MGDPKLRTDEDQIPVRGRKTPVSIGQHYKIWLITKLPKFDSAETTKQSIRRTVYLILLKKDRERLKGERVGQQLQIHKLQLQE